LQNKREKQIDVSHYEHNITGVYLILSLLRDLDSFRKTHDETKTFCKEKQVVRKEERKTKGKFIFTIIG